MRLTLHIGNLAKNSQKLVPIPAFRPFLKPLPSRELFRKCGREDIVHGDVMSLGDSSSLLV